MCGIWAIFGFSDYSKYVQYAMNISSRGPDCFRMETIPNFKDCLVAFHRLAITDSLHGMQPMRVWQLPHLYLICNGKIYNYKMLEEKFNFDLKTKCDAEIILHLYDKFNGVEKVAQLLDGVFAFCIVDTKKKQVHMSRDTFGVRPLFTLTTKGTKKAPLALCSEVKSLVPIEKHVSNNAIQVILEPFQPGEYASYSLDSDGLLTLIEKGPYTYIGKRPAFDTMVKPDSSDYLGNLRNLFTEAVKKRLMGDRRIGCLLSGGLDSSLIAALLTKLSKEAGKDYPIQTFSIGMEGSTDLPMARKAAAHIGSDHHEFSLTVEEGIQALRDIIYTLESYEVLSIRASVGLYLVTKHISNETDTIVVCSGEGSDELCQGYIYYHKAPSSEVADKDAKRLLKDLWLHDVLRSDRVTAGHGLEVRLPFLDVDYTSYVLSLPAELRRPSARDNGKCRIEKWLVRAAFDGTDLLPEEILWREKECFSDGIASNEPGKSWFEIVQKFVESEVSDEAFSKAKSLYPFNTPPSKEAFYYRQIFEEFFPGHGKLTPYYWMPRWVEATDPSARALPHYQKRF